ncbi:MAG: energy transducer TonB [Ferruginibacter sp.]
MRNIIFQAIDWRDIEKLKKILSSHKMNMYLPKVLLTACIIFSGLSLPAQVTRQPDTVKTNSTALTVVETEASYPGGNEAWKKFLQKNLNSNVPNKNNAPIGMYTTIVLFIVSKDGLVSSIKPVTNFGYGMEEEVIRVMERSGKWTPAIQNGRPVNAYRKQPITFLLQSADFEVSTPEPYTLFTDTDNEITITARKIKPEDISINVQGGKATKVSDGKFIIRPAKPGRVTIEIVNNKKDDKEIGTASFEVKAK